MKDEKPAAAKPRQRFQVPWGLFIALAVYAGMVAGYIQLTYWSSPEYQAVQHFDRAWEILGPAEGRTASREELVAAYEHLLEAARLAPDVTKLHEQLERLNWRFEERHLSMPDDLRRRADAVAVLWQRIQQERAPILAVGVRNRGWAADQLREGPGQAVIWSLVGVLVILGAWAYLRFGARQVQEVERDKELKQMEAEVRELAGHRADTDPESPAVRPPRPATKRRK
jgi:hypothetical protein